MNYHQIAMIIMNISSPLSLTDSIHFLISHIYPFWSNHSWVEIHHFQQEHHFLGGHGAVHGMQGELRTEKNLRQSSTNPGMIIFISQTFR